MKKILCLLLILFASFVLVSCGEEPVNVSLPEDYTIETTQTITYDGNYHDISYPSLPEGFTIEMVNGNKKEVGSYTVIVLIKDSTGKVVKNVSVKLVIQENQIPTGALTVAEAIEEMKDYTSNQVSLEEYTVTGKVTTSSYNSTYGSYTLYLEAPGGYTFQVYSAQLASSITSKYTKADALKDATIVVKGYLKLFVNSSTSEKTYEIAYISATKSSPIISSITGGTPDQDTPVDPSKTYTPVDSVKVGDNYKYVVEHKGLSKIFFIQGEMANTYYYQVTETLSDAAIITLEQTTGGYFLKVGSNYANITSDASHDTVHLEATASTVWTFDATAHTMICTVNSKTFTLGCRSGETYSTIRAVEFGKGHYEGYLISAGGSVTPTDPLTNYTVNTNQTFAYDGSAKNVTYPELPSGYTMEVLGDGNIEEGTYTVTLNVKDSSGATKKSFTVTVKIEKVVAPSGTLSVAEAIAVMASFASGEVSDETYSVTGTVKSSSYNSTYGSYELYLDAPEGYTFQVYSAKLDSSITSKYTKDDALKGATIVAKGYLKLFVNSSTSEKTYELAYINSKTGDPYQSPIISSIVGGTPDSSGGDTPIVPVVDDEYTPVDSVSVGTEYVMFMTHAGLSKTLFVEGSMDTYYLKSTESFDSAATITLVAVEGGYSLKCNSKYINITKGMGSDQKEHINVTLDDTATSVWTFDSNTKLIQTVVDSVSYGLGTRTDKTYNTFSSTDVSSSAYFGYLTLKNGSDPTVIVDPDFDRTGIVFADTNVKHDGEAHSILLTGLKSGYTVSYEGNDQTEVGVYQVTAIIKEGNEVVAKFFATLTITDGNSEHFDGPFVS